MPVYLSLGATRIQVYLGRTPTLRHRRGASALVTRAFDAFQLASAVRKASPGFTVSVAACQQAPAVDGVAELELPDGTSDAVVTELIIAALGQVWQAAPRCEVTAVWATASTYAEGDRIRRQKLAAGDVIVCLPPTDEFPATLPCDVCAIDPVASEIPKPGGAGTSRVCVDCHARDREQWRVAGSAEGALAEGLQAHTRAVKAPAFADDFSQLAALGDPVRGANHLCTLFADGNAVGALFDVVATRQDAAELTLAASTALKSAGRTAVAIATEAVRNDADQVLPVVPHVFGGDDLLCSVVADRAWAFVDAFINAFDFEIRARLASVADDLPIPSMSVGLVFAHASYPFRRALELAEDALRRAKVSVAGRAPSVAFLDVTAEGEQTSRPGIPYSLLTAKASALHELGRLPRAARSTLADRWGDGLPHQRLEARNTASRLRAQNLLDAFAEPPLLLPDALRLLRWWS